MTVDVASLEEPPAAAVEVFGECFEQASEYARLLATAGVERGLIGPREGPRLWTRHLLNSAALSHWVPQGTEVVDLGSGAGLPGIPLALARLDLRVILVEPMARRVDFLGEVVQALGLDNVAVRRCRGEDLPPRSADVVVARAVAPLHKLITVARPVLRTHGLLIALKGSNAEKELAEAAGVLKSWRGTRGAVLRAATGGEVTTAVMIGPDGMLPDIAQVDGGGSAR